MGEVIVESKGLNGRKKKHGAILKKEKVQGLTKGKASHKLDNRKGRQREGGGKGEVRFIAMEKNSRAEKGQVQGLAKEKRSLGLDRGKGG